LRQFIDGNLVLICSRFTMLLTHFLA